MIDADADLREWFQRMREHDRAAAPAFETILSRTPVLRRGPRYAMAAGGFALLVVGVFFAMLHRGPNEFDVSAVALPAWNSPTDFLLARADDSLQRLSWAPSPTSVLGQPSFNRYRETR